MKIYAKIITGLFLTGVVCSTQAVARQEANADESAKESIERIEVEGQDPNFYLEQFRKERDAFYQHYNALVGEDSDLRINCGKRKPDWAPAKLRKKDYCEPQFVYNLEHQETQTKLAFLTIKDMNGDPRHGIQPNPVSANLKKKKQEMTQVMSKLVNEDPDLKAKYQNFTEAEAKYRTNQ